MPTNPALDVFQVGIQSSFGTAVAATAKLAVPEVQFRDAGGRDNPQVAVGAAIANRGYEHVVFRATDWAIVDAPLYYEQLQLWLANVVAGGVSASGGDPYTWTYTRDITADPALDPLTLERRTSDFSSNVDMEIADCYGRMFKLTYAENEDAKFSVDGFGRAMDDTASLTGAQSLPTPEFAPSARMAVYLDTSWANRGNTQLSSQVIGLDWEFRSGYQPRWTADGRSNLDYTIAELNSDNVNCILRLLVLMDATQYATELTAAQAQSERVIQALLSGSQSRSFSMSGIFKYTNVDLLEIGANNGQHTVALNLEGTRDSSDNFFEAVVVNKTNQPDGV